MFGSFQFGEQVFGKEERVEIIRPSMIVGGGGSGKWPRYISVMERVARVTSGVATVDSHRLTLHLGRVRASGAAAAAIKGASVRAQAGQVSGHAGARVRIQCNRIQSAQAGAVNGQGEAHARIISHSHVESALRMPLVTGARNMFSAEDEEIIAALLLS